jgi:hypothetical protein
MPESSGAAGVLELERPMPAPDITQGMGEIGMDVPQAAAVTPEMPVSHANVDPQTLTKDGLIKACSYFAGIAAKNPALANKMAEGAVQAARHGNSAETGAADPFAALRERRKQKAAERENAKPKESLAESEPAEEAVAPITVNEALTPVEATPPTPAETPAPVVRPSILITAAKKETPQPEVLPVAPPAMEVPTEASVTKAEIAPPVAEPPVMAEVVPAAETVATYEPPLAYAELPDIAPSPEVPATEYEPWSAAERSLPPLEATAESAEPVELTYPPLPEIAVTEITASPTEAPIVEASMAIPTIEAPATQPAVEQVTWADELDKEPEGLFNDFTETLQVFVAPAKQESSVAAETNIEDTSHAVVPPIAVIVAERLTTIEPAQKETVVPVVHDIVIAAQTVEVLMTQKAEPEAIEAAVAQLEEQIVELFEQLGIEYAPQDIEQFMRVLFRRDFVPPQPEPAITQTANLETDGTHEAKSPWMHWAATVWDEVERDMQHLIGSFALFTYLALPPMQTVTADS